MIDLTPLDVRKKRGDFGKSVRGYNPQEVDTFLELVAERLEELVKVKMTLQERVDRLSEQVTAQTGRERAVHEALVTAQQLREETRVNADKEAELIRQEARTEAREILAKAEREARDRTEALHDLEHRRKRFLVAFRQFLEREMDAVEVEASREPLADAPVIDLDLGGGRAPESGEAEPPPEVTEEAPGPRPGFPDHSLPVDGRD